MGIPYVSLLRSLARFTPQPQSQLRIGGQCNHGMRHICHRVTNHAAALIKLLRKNRQAGGNDGQPTQHALYHSLRKGFPHHMFIA